MAEISPGSAPREGRSGVSTVRALFLGVVYLLLVPVAALAGLWISATYFPSATSSLLGPVLTSIITETPQKDTSGQDALAKAVLLEERMGKIESDIAGLLERQAAVGPVTGDPAAGVPNAGEQPSDPDSEAALAAEQVAAEAARRSAERDRALAALFAVTLARVQAVTGNREVALREAEFALKILKESSPEFCPAESQEMLLGAIADLRGGSPTADDRLSIVWHALVESLSPSGKTPSQQEQSK